MTHNLKFLGLALVAALALSAVLASAAWADEFKAESAPVTLTGTQEKHTDPVSGQQVFDKRKVHGGTIECSTINRTGSQATISAATMSLARTYAGCTFTGLALTVETNGCEDVYHFTGATTTGTMDIACPAGKEITFIVVAPPGTTRCIIHIPPQTGLNGVTYTNLGIGTTREITIAMKTTNMNYSQTAGSGSGACATADNTTNGVYEGALIVTGEGAPGHIGIWIG